MFFLSCYSAYVLYHKEPKVLCCDVKPLAAVISLNMEMVRNLTLFPLGGEFTPFSIDHVPGYYHIPLFFNCYS